MNRKNIALKRATVKDRIVVGIDIGKYWHVACALLPTGEFLKPMRFSNNGHGFTKLLDYISSARAERGEVLIGVESTGHYWEPLAYWLDKKGFKLVQVNPLHTKKAKDLLDNSPLKSDPKDAMIIADLIAQGKFLTFILPKGKFAELRQLMNSRARLAKARTARVNLLHYFVDKFFPEFTEVFPNLRTKSALYLLRNFFPPHRILSKEFEEMYRALKKISRGRVTRVKVEALYSLARDSVGVQEGLECLPPLIGQTLCSLEEIMEQMKEIENLAKGILAKIPQAKFLMSMKGIGPMIAATILGEVGDLGLYKRACEVIKLAGLNLYEVSSGIYKGRKRITKRGRSLLRYILYLAAVIQTKRGMPLHNFYVSLIRRNVHKQKALIAVACKLLRILFALVRDGRSYTEELPTFYSQAA